MARVVRVSESAAWRPERVCDAASERALEALDLTDEEVLQLWRDGRLRVVL